MSVMRSPSGPSTAPKWAPAARTSVDTPRACSRRSKVTERRAAAYGLTDSTSAPSLPRTAGMTNDAAPEGVVEDDLEARRPDGAGVDLVDQGLGVKVGHARRVDDVARLGGQAAAEVLSVKDPLDLALGHVRDVDAGRVDEAEDDGLGVLVGQADGDPSGTVLVAHAEARHRARSPPRGR